MRCLSILLLFVVTPFTSGQVSPPMPFFLVDKLDPALCTNVPVAELATITKSPTTEACKIKTVAAGDQVCLCLKPTDAVKKMVEAMGTKIPNTKNGFMPVCGICDESNMWNPLL